MTYVFVVHFHLTSYLRWKYQPTFKLHSLVNWYYNLTWEQEFCKIYESVLRESVGYTEFTIESIAYLLLLLKFKISAIHLYISKICFIYMYFFRYVFFFSESQLLNIYQHTTGHWCFARVTDKCWLLDTENRLMVAKGEGVGGRMDWEFGVSRGKLLHIAWINNKVLLYSTRNYIQYPMINHNGKEY